jgi:hypothetical protein
MASLRILASRNFVAAGDTEPALLTGVLTADGLPGAEVAVLRAQPVVLLEDLSGPTITHPASVTAEATSPAGAVVNFTVTATDPFDPAPTVSCVPASGSLFPIGTTTVACTATDAQGNEREASFPVTVKSAVTQISDLIAVVAGLDLTPPVKNGLIKKLEEADGLLAKGNLTGACRKLGDFMDQVRAQTGKALTEAEAERLLTDARRIQAAMGCA